MWVNILPDFFLHNMLCYVYSSCYSSCSYCTRSFRSVHDSSPAVKFEQNTYGFVKTWLSPWPFKFKHYAPHYQSIPISRYAHSMQVNNKHALHCPLGNYFPDLIKRCSKWGEKMKGMRSLGEKKKILWRRLNTGNLIKILQRLVKSAQGFAAPYESGRLHPKLEENDSDDALWPQPRASGNVGTRTSRFRWVQTSEPHTKLHFYL